jgi:hypothetical protein
MAITFDDDQTAALFDLLGLPADTTDVDTILATITDLANDETGDGGNAKPSAVAAAAKRAGLEVLDADTATALRRDAAEGRQIKAAVALEKVAASVDDAISRGKITAGRRKHWLSLIAADPGMAEVLASVPDETAVPLTEIGHSAASEGGDIADAADNARSASALRASAGRLPRRIRTRNGHRWTTRSFECLPT